MLSKTNNSLETPALKLMPMAATHWMALSAHEITGRSLETAADAYKAMAVSAPDALIPALSEREVAACIEAARRRAEEDESRSWAQHLVMEVQQKMAATFHARVLDPRTSSRQSPAMTRHR